MTRTARRAAVYASAALSLWAAFYIYRTSFVAAGRRVFCLWDDAMISMTYARNLADGNGLVWNVGEFPVQGFTNLGVTLAMTLVHLTGAPLHLTSAIVQFGAVAALVAMTFLVARLCSRLTATRTVSTAAVYGMLLAAPLMVWTLQGSDVGPAALWILASLAVISSRQRKLSFSAQACVLAIGPIIRPDLALFSGILGLFAALRAPPKQRAKRLMLFAFPSVLSLGGVLIFSAAYFGDPLPNTYYLKTAGFPPGLRLKSGLWHLQQSLPTLALALSVAALGVWHNRSKRLVQLLGALVVTAIVYNVWTGGDWAERWGSRFVVPVWPQLVILVALGAAMLVARLGEHFPAVASESGRKRATVGLTAIVIGLSNPAGAFVDWFVPTAAPMYRGDNQRNFHKAQWLAANLPPDASLAVHWAGVPIYFTGLRGVDVLGKSDPHIARLKVQRFIPGHSKWDWDYVVGQRQPTAFLRQSRGLLNNKQFAREYVAVEAGVELDFFVRRDRLNDLKTRKVRVADIERGIYVPFAVAARLPQGATPSETSPRSSRGARPQSPGRDP